MTRSANRRGRDAPCDASEFDLHKLQRRFVHGHGGTGEQLCVGACWPNLAGGTMTVSTTYKTPAGGVGTNIVSDFVVVQITYVFPITMPFVPKIQSP